MEAERGFQAVSALRLQDQVKALALEAGFADAGIAPVPVPGSETDTEHRARYREWVDAGRAGEMEYLKRTNEEGQLIRSSLRIAAPWARSVIVCAANYNSLAPRSVDPAPAGAGWIARYAWSGQEDGRPSDYHKVLLARLRKLEAALFQKLGSFESKCYVDTGPLVEREAARLAGIGWTGKNTCTLNQELGSWFFLGVILTSLPVPEDAATLPAADRCGSCTRCIDACPTNALIAPRQMDASRCISYLTIEKRGAIDEQLRGGMGRQIFGCDICQDVCPWNRKASVANDLQLRPRAALVNPALEWLASLDRDDFGKLFFGSPIKRARYEGLRRNVAIAMGNSGLPEYLPTLQEWASGTEEVLADAARWAIRQIENKG